MPRRLRDGRRGQRFAGGERCEVDELSDVSESGRLGGQTQSGRGGGCRGGGLSATCENRSAGGAHL